MQSHRRWKQLYEAALNLGMRDDHAQFYATDAFEAERAQQEWRRRNDFQRDCDATI